MAKKRMFSIEIVDSDAFLEMPISSQLLYFHLNMRADDDGFINNPKQIMKFVGSSEDDMKLLIAKKFVIPFESGVVVIKHWKIHNYIQSDRYHETNYKVEKSMLLLDENNAYTQDVSKMYPPCIQNVSSDKIRVDKVSKDKINKGGKKFIPPTLDEVKEYAESRGRSDIAKKFWEWYQEGDWLNRDGKPIRAWKQKFIYWESTNPAPVKLPSQKEMPVVVSENAIPCPDDVKVKLSNFLGGE